MRADENAETAVGEGEIRMQSHLESYFEFLPNVVTHFHAWQISSDSDNICPALLMFEKRKFRKDENVLIKFPSVPVNIPALHVRLKYMNISPTTFLRLYNAFGNAFRTGCCVATPLFLSRTYIKYKNVIGDLSTPESLESLYFITFLIRYSFQNEVPDSRFELFSDFWKKKLVAE